MKKYKGLIVSAGVLAVVLIAYFIITTIPEDTGDNFELDESTSIPEVNHLVQVEYENLKSVAVDVENGYTINAEQTMVEDDAGEEQTVMEYSLAEPKDVAYLSGSFEEAAYALSNITIDSEPVATDNHAEYGLDSPVAVITVTHTDGTTTYEVGDLAPGESDYYAKLADNDEIWLIPSSAVEYALNGEWQFRDKLLFSFSEGEEYSAVETFKLERKGQETVELALLETVEDEFSSVYELLQPLKHEANDNVFLESVIYNLASLGYSEIIEDSPQDLEKYGIPNVSDQSSENSNETIGNEAEPTELAHDNENVVDEELAVDDSSVDVIDENSPFARITINEDLIITLGDFTDETNSYYYATVSGIDAVVTFPASSFPYLDVKYVDLMSSLLWLHNIVEAESVDIVTPSGEHTLILNHKVNPDDPEDTWMEPTLDGEEIEEDFAKDIYLAALSVTMSNIIEGEPELSDFDYTLTINMLNSESYTMDFYRINERQYGAVKDGQPLPFYVNIDLLVYIEEIIADIKAGVHES